jgi:hypothetical protein
MTFITEPALYMLAFKSHKKEAIDFTKWVCETVLPSIRKTGKFEILEPAYRTVKPMLTYKIENEEDLHRKTVNFLRSDEFKDKELLFNASLGEMINDTPDKRLKAYYMGYTKGMGDLIIFNPTRNKAGCLIEFKTVRCNGKVSPEQLNVIQHFEKLNYKIIVSNDYDKIICQLYDYIKDVRVRCPHCKCMFKSTETLGNHKKHFHRITTLVTVGTTTTE